jgi:hypothetical protein
VLVVGVSHLVHQHVHGLVCEEVERRGDRGERDDGLGGELDVVEANDRNVLRDLDALSHQRM